ncbi:MAG: TorF family putative porin [Gammaproteobacteria bacterium]|nr:TorF family putative porin [Gammaproteobacteria bacterium]
MISRLVPSGPAKTVLLALCAASASTHAQEFTFYGAITSDYVYRGVSNSDDHGALQLGIDVNTDSGLYGGVWASTTDITNGNRNRSREVDYYLGYVHYFDNDWSASLSINRYSYPGSDGNVDYDYTELTAIIGIHERLWFEVDYTDSVFGHDQPAYNLAALASWPLTASLTLTAGVGHFDVSEIADNAYSYWQIGVSRPLAWTTVDFRYHDTNNVPAQISLSELADPRIALTISAAF